MQSMLLNDRIEKIKDNDQEINRFVEEYKPFIASCTEKVTGRYVRYGEDDELSIALIAFVEAIRSFDSQKGSFLSFSQNVIRRRLIDYFRKESKHGNVISLSEYTDAGEEEVDLSADVSVDKFNSDEIARYRRLEIEELKKELASWDISFFDLADASPKHSNTRTMCSSIVEFILRHTEVVKVIKEKKYLPIIEIEKGLKLPRKKIERVRKYIIAAVIIKTGDYQYIEEYISS